MNRRTLLASLTSGAALLASNARLLGQEAAGGPGPSNLITDVPGLRVGQAEDAKVRTGVTVILADDRDTCAVDVRGGGPGTRETDVLDSWNLVHSADAVVLSGGSVYGLAAADGVAAWLGAHDRGYGMSSARGRSQIAHRARRRSFMTLPITATRPGASTRPIAILACARSKAAAHDFKLGTAGAGYGAEAGALKGGVGSASYVTKDGMRSAPSSPSTAWVRRSCRGPSNFWAGPFEIGNEFGGLGASNERVVGEDWGQTKANPGARTNTTIACIATDVELDIDQMKRVTMMAQDGLARAIRPIHSPFDGDVVFGLSTAKQKIKGPSADFVVARIGAIAADVLARAVARGVYEATLPPGTEGKIWRTL